MKSRTVLIMVAAIAAIMLLLAAVPYLIPTSTYQGWLQRHVAVQFDGRLSIEKIRLQLIPYPGYTIRGFLMTSSKPPFQGLPLISAKKVTGTLSIWGLVRGKVDTDIIASDVTIDYRMTGGETNLDSLVRAPGTSPPPASPTVGEPRNIPPPAAMPYEIPAIKGPDITPPPEVTPTPATPEAAPQVRPSGSLEGLFIKALDVSMGRINVWESGSVSFSIENAEIAAAGLSFAKGIAFDVRMTGAASLPFLAATDAQAPQTQTRMSGRLFIDTERREVAARDLKLSAFELQSTADLSVNYGATPISFDIHLATPNFNSSALVFLTTAFSTRKLPSDFSWQGPSAIDVSLKGTRAAYEAKIHVDASPSKLAYADLFSKGAGMTCKGMLSLIAGENSIAISEGTLSLGQGTISVKGQVQRDENSTARLTIAENGIDGATLKLFFPKFLAADDITGLSITADADGALIGQTPMKITGAFNAAGLKIAGVEISEVEGNFEKGSSTPSAEAVPGSTAASPSTINLPVLKGKLFGGRLSGNGSISIGEPFEFTVDSVIEQLDAATIPAMVGSIAGTGSMVVRATARGNDPASLASSLNVTGSLLMGKASWAASKPMQQIFAAETWKWIEEQSKMTLTGAIVEKLSSASVDMEGFKITFESAEGGGLKIGSIEWNHPMYSAKISAAIDRSYIMAASGDVLILKSMASQLIPTAAQKILLDADGALDIPVTISGKLPELAAAIDRSKLSATIEAALAKAAAAVAPKAAAAKPAKEPRPANKPAPKAEAKPPDKPPEIAKEPEIKGDTKTMPKQDEEDVLKVIIGK